MSLKQINLFVFKKSFLIQKFLSSLFISYISEANETSTNQVNCKNKATNLNFRLEIENIEFKKELRL